jgi:hypothetical protein
LAGVGFRPHPTIPDVQQEGRIIQQLDEKGRILVREATEP